MKKIAFTLAEVLLTLTIVGVVSALTVPNIMSAVDEKELQAQAKKAYNTLQTAVNMVYATTRRTPEDVTQTKLLGFFVSGSHGAQVLKTVENQDGSTWPWVVGTADGAIYFVKREGHNCVKNPASIAQTCFIMVDINGTDGPNFSVVNYGGGQTAAGMDASTLEWNSSAFSASTYDKRYRDIVFFAIKGMSVEPYMGSGVTKYYFTGVK